MHEPINEKVSVISVYDRVRGSFAPARIRWQGRDYSISKIGYCYKAKQGRTLMHFFQVTDGLLAFKLRFDTDVLSWTLEEVSDGNAA